MGDQSKPEVSVEDRLMDYLDTEEAAPGDSEEQPEGEAETEREAEPESDEGEAEGTEDETEDGTEADPFYITHNGEQKALSVEEARELAQKGYDYTQKTQEVSEQRRHVEVKEAALKQHSEELQKYESDLGLIMALDHQIGVYQKLDWPALADQDITEFTKRKEELRDLKDARAEAAKSLDDKRAKDRDRAQRETAKRLTEHQETLKRQIKGWGPEMQAQLKTAAKSYGATEESIAKLDEPWLVLALHDAMKYKGLKASKPQVEKRVAGKPKVMKPGNKPVPDNYAELRKQAKSASGRRQEDLMAEALAARL